MDSLSFMSWNWEEPDWPEFTWDEHRLALAEQQFLVRGGIYVGAGMRVKPPRTSV